MGNHLPPTREMRDAVFARDARYDGRFVYGSEDAGVFCRPGCRVQAQCAEGYRFFLNAASALIAGFTPCTKCQDPRLSGLVTVARHIEGHAEEALPLTALAELIGWSPSHLQRRFRATFGVSPKAYQDALRLRRLKSALREEESVTAAIYEAGYGSASRAYEMAERRMGMTPAAYRKGGAREEIRHASARTAFGWLTLGATPRGLCFAMLGDDEKGLLSALKAEFPNAELAAATPDEDQLDQWIVSLDSALRGDGPLPDLPLDLRGTAFQIKVWSFLTKIPSGTTVTYSEVASGIGQPKAVRAAATACARNRVALLVPCHRVLRAGGGIGGYRWGPERKKALLEREGHETS